MGKCSFRKLDSGDSRFRAVLPSAERLGMPWVESLKNKGVVNDDFHEDVVQTDAPELFNPNVCKSLNVAEGDSPGSLCVSPMEPSTQAMHTAGSLCRCPPFCHSIHIVPFDSPVRTAICPPSPDAEPSGK